MYITAPFPKQLGHCVDTKKICFFLINMFILNLINATNINKVQTTSPDDCNKEDDWPLICRTKAGEGFANISNLHKKQY